MRRYVYAAALFLAASAPGSADVRIRSSPGGEVLSHLTLFELVRKSGERVIIDGPCLSACTLVLSVVNVGHRGNLSDAGSRLDRPAWRALSTSSIAPWPGAHGDVSRLQLGRCIRWETDYLGYHSIIRTNLAKDRPAFVSVVPLRYVKHFTQEGYAL